MSLCERGQACSCFIDRLAGKDWTVCCVNHDKGYRSNYRQQTKDEVDAEFYECLVCKTWKWLAWCMYKIVSKSSIAHGYWNGYREKEK